MDTLGDINYARKKARHMRAVTRNTHGRRENARLVYTTEWSHGNLSAVHRSRTAAARRIAVHPPNRLMAPCASRWIGNTGVAK